MNISAISIISKYRKAYKNALEKNDFDAIFLMFLYNEILKLCKNKKIESDTKLKSQIIGRLFNIRRDLEHCLRHAISEKDEFQQTCMSRNIFLMEILENEKINFD